MKFKDLSISNRMDWACRYLIIHSYLYYLYNVSIISDKDYDTKLKWLCEYVKSNPLEVDKCQYKNVLLNLDPSTGFDMQNYIEPTHYEYLKQIAQYTYQQYKLDNIKQKGRQ